MTTYGTHVLLNIKTEIDEPALSDVDHLNKGLREAAILAGATILSDHWHTFGEGCGVTGVIMLSESHISIHTWPETGFAAVDIFTCGKADPVKAVNHIVHTVRGISSEIKVVSREL